MIETDDEPAETSNNTDPRWAHIDPDEPGSTWEDMQDDGTWPTWL